MQITQFDPKAVRRYLIWTFAIAWIMQAAVAFLSQTDFAAIAQPLMSIMMFVPLFGVLLSGQKLKGMGWSPHLKGKVKPILIAFFLPTLLTALGAALFFLLFPGYFDLTGSAVGENTLKTLEMQGMTYPVYILICVIECLTFAPFINMVFAVGEEAGWRGFLYPQLKLRFGKVGGRLLGGVIWGLWHAPLIWLIGYEYGTTYFGFPVVGILLFCVISTALGILCDVLYEKSKLIWVPALFHGAYNAAATVPMAICIAETRSECLLGPAPVGILSALPCIALAVFLLLRKPKSQA